MWTVEAADVCCPEDIALAIEHQSSVWVGAVAVLISGPDPREGVQHLLRPLAALLLRRIQLEHHSALAPVKRVASRAFAAAKGSRPVQVACFVEHQITPWEVALLGSGETVQDDLRPRTAGLSW